MHTRPVTFQMPETNTAAAAPTCGSDAPALSPDQEPHRTSPDAVAASHDPPVAGDPAVPAANAVPKDASTGKAGAVGKGAGAKKLTQAKGAHKDAGHRKKSVIDPAEDLLVGMQGYLRTTKVNLARDLEQLRALEPDGTSGRQQRVEKTIKALAALWQLGLPTYDALTALSGNRTAQPVTKPTAA